MEELTHEATWIAHGAAKSDVSYRPACCYHGEAYN